MFVFSRECATWPRRALTLNDREPILVTQSCCLAWKGRNVTRVINTQGPGKRRNHLRRTIAEIMRHLVSKHEIDEETKDMAGALVYSLRGIAETIETTTEAWEKRNYFLKADRFRLEWEWVVPAAERLQELVINDRWEGLPAAIAELASHFADIRVAKMTRSPSTWVSSYRLLLSES